MQRYASMDLFVAVLVVLLVAMVSHTTAKPAVLDATVHVSSKTMSAAAPSGFASFSVEVPCVPAMITNSSSGEVRQSYINLMAHLRNVSGAAGPNLRIGGNSADNTWYSPNAVRPPSGDDNTVTNADVHTYTYVKNWSGSVDVDLNLRATKTIGNAVAYAKVAKSALTSAEIPTLFELGNEPDLYRSNKYRPMNFTYEEYDAEFTALLTSLVDAGVIPADDPKWVQGGTWAEPTWLSELDGYIKQHATYMKTLSLHFYAIHRNRNKATIERLMSDECSNMSHFAPFAAYAKQQGVDFVIGEGNSVNNGGEVGVSDSLASALWAVDMLLNALDAGILRFNFHGCVHGGYTPIDTETYGYAWAKPLYYGMWATTAALRDGAKYVPLTVDSTDANLGGYRVHAVRTTSAVRVIVIGKGANLANITDSPRLRARVFVEGVAPNSVCEVRRLVASQPGRLDVRSGLSFGGLTFDGSRAGTPTGTPVEERVKVEPDGSFTVEVDPATAALIEIAL